MKQKKIKQLRNLTLILKNNKFQETEDVLASRDEIDKRMKQILEKKCVTYEAKTRKIIEDGKPSQYSSSSEGRLGKRDELRLISMTEIHLDTLYEQSRQLREDVVDSQRKERLQKIQRSAVAIFNTKVKKMM